MDRSGGGIGRLAAACAALVLSLTVLLAVAARADGPPSLLVVNVADSHITLGMLAPPGSTVTFSEVVDGAREELGTAPAGVPSGPGLGLAALLPVPWTCDRQIRDFVAEARTGDGRVVTAVNQTRTPDCRERVALDAPSRVEPGARIPITLKDRWRVGGVRLHLCAVRPGAPRRCWWFELAPGQTAISLERRAGVTPGVLDLGLEVAGFHQHLKVGVGRAAPVDTGRPVALVTGDSLTEGIDTLLSAHLRARYRVVGKPRAGTGVSAPVGERWTQYARDEARVLKPSLTVVLIGVNDGYPMTTPSGGKVACCGAPWRAEYLARITAMARAYLQAGRGRLVWALLPPPRRGELVEQFSAVNDTVRRLAAAMPQIRLVPLDTVFGPAYRDVIDGRRVRDLDGVHFSLAGQRIAARAIVAAIHTAEGAP